MITIVSGLPRSGTSLMMQMLKAGGLPVLTDGSRLADANNPRGYFEMESVKTLASNPDVMATADGKVVKVVSSLLPALPNTYQYKVVFMCRPLEEVIQSQDRMLERLGKPIPSHSQESAKAAFRKHLQHIRGWIERQANMGVLYVEYARVLRDATGEASGIAKFLGPPLDVVAMAQQVDVTLHRERTGARVV
jgi:hypothetical protein